MFLKEFLHKNTASFSFLFVCMSETNNEKTNHFQCKLCLDFILFLRTDLWFQIPKLFKKSCLKVSRKIFPFKEKITSFQYNYSTRSLFCQFLPLGHILGSFVEWFGWPTTNFFYQRKNFDPLSDGLATETILFFLYWGSSFTPLLSTNWEKFYVFFFFHRTRKLRLNYLPPSICQNPWKWWWFRRNSPDRIQKKQ